MQGIVWSSSSTSRPSRSRGGWTSLVHFSVVGNSRTPWRTSPHVGTTSVSPHALLVVDISPPSLSIAKACGLVDEIGIPPFSHHTNLPDLAFRSGFFLPATTSGDFHDQPVGFRSHRHLARPSASRCHRKFALLHAQRRASCRD
ncbi:hypothetical protein TIFTF001_026168 [Ficus carica]|uniref:Uncharacterized protein n=1 Tax=Ficus carica TaxID=3494 RepID=A0AA88IY82_FICCA|nr:hypothetical protein TIFTF001_026168 [Ficus carica]